ncbi:uncharacterized protein LOC128217856 [Mya arenaria]|uniref:uncharacterized protein LOC128217856 n=1 Tax=Mya arenaria TaxID=6604 RepID=UPI0022E1825A|nr:uncharacterized protein LOC128217856 [Mya arenaria]
MASKNKRTGNTYTQLSALKCGTVVDVYGVVCFVKPTYKTRGSDYCTMISIVDQSLKGVDEKLKCLLFGSEEKLPSPDVGDIIRFHRLMINMFRDNLQGQNRPGFSWLVFSGDPSLPLEPKSASSNSYTFNEKDKDKVTELRMWAHKKQELQQSLCQICDVAAGCYFDLFCQVVRTAVLEADVARLLTVWDGTQSIYTVREMSADHQLQDLKTDDHLRKQARGFMYDVTVFDDHYHSSANIKAGDFVKFVNLHAPEYQPPNQPYSPTVELVLHRGNSYSRCVRVVPPDFPLLEDMKKMFDVIAIDNDNSEEDDVGETENTAEQCEPENVGGHSINNSKFLLQQSNEKLDVSKAPYTKTLNGEKNEEDAVDRKLRSSDKGKRPMNPKLTNGPKTCCPNKRDAVVILPKSSANSSSVEEVNNENFTKEINSNSTISKNNFKKPTASTKVQFNVDSPSTEKDDQLKDTRSFRFKRQPLGKSKDHNDNEPDNKKRKIDTCSETRIAASQKNTQDESHVFSTANETEESLILSCEMSQAYSTQAEDLSQVSQLVNVGTESQSQCLSELESQSSDRVPPSREMSGRSIKDSGVVGKGSQRLGDMDMTDSSGFRRCILQTNTVILGHPNIARSTLRVVLDHSVPYKFCVRAQVLDYHPKPDTVTDFVHLYCSQCHYLSPHPDKDKGKGKGDNSELSVGSTFQGVPHYSCPKCLENRASLSGLESPPHLTYIYAMRLILRDDTGMVMVNIWKDDAVQFFHDVTPIQLLGKTVSFDLIKDSLAQICPQEVEPINRPWIECCLRSHSNQHGTFFQIFDTTIV